MSTPKYTVIASYVQVIAKALENEGINSKAIFEQAKIEYNQIASPEARIPYKKVAQLFNLAVKATNNPEFGLYSSKFLLPSHLHAFGTSLLVSNNLLDFLKQFQIFSRFIANTADFYVIENKNTVDFKCKLLVPICYEAQDNFISFILRFMRSLSITELSPLSVELCRPAPSIGVEDYSKFFKCPIQYCAEEISLTFEKDALLNSLQTASNTLVKLNDQVMIDYLDKQGKLDLLPRIRESINECLPFHLCSKTEIAKRVGLSVRSLQNKLAEEDLTFQQLLDKCRFSQAKSYLVNGKSLTEISDLLGFSEVSSFSRSFKRWAGTSPNSYLKQAFHSKQDKSS